MCLERDDRDFGVAALTCAARTRGVAVETRPAAASTGSVAESGSTRLGCCRDRGRTAARTVTGACAGCNGTLTGDRAANDTARSARRAGREDPCRAARAARTRGVGGGDAAPRTRAARSARVDSRSCRAHAARAAGAATCRGERSPGTASRARGCRAAAALRPSKGSEKGSTGRGEGRCRAIHAERAVRAVSRSRRAPGPARADHDVERSAEGASREPLSVDHPTGAARTTAAADRPCCSSTTGAASAAAADERDERSDRAGRERSAAAGREREGLLLSAASVGVSAARGRNVVSGAGR